MTRQPPDSSPSFPPRKILVAVDFSEPSLRAWGLARHLGTALKAQVEALFAYEPGAGDSDPAVPAGPLSEHEKSVLVGDLRQKLGPDAVVTIAEGFAKQEILGAASRGWEVHLIVMGTHGRTGVARMLMGSVAEELSRLSPVPVLTVRGSWRPVRSVLAPVSFAPFALKGLGPAAILAQALGARLDVLYVGAFPSSEERSEFDKAAAGIASRFSGRSPELFVRSGDPAREILEAGDSYDLIALSARRGPFPKGVVPGNTAAHVIRRSSVPVLILPA